MVDCQNGREANTGEPGSGKPLGYGSITYLHPGLIIRALDGEVASASGIDPRIVEYTARRLLRQDVPPSNPSDADLWAGELGEQLRDRLGIDPEDPKEHVEGILNLELLKVFEGRPEGKFLEQRL